MTSIRLENVTKSWGPVDAVANVSFTVPPRSLTVLLGPSGCGKSTLLRIVAGLETSTSGKIFIGDRDVTNAPPAERNISMVFQSYALFPHLNVAENILFGLKVRKASSAKQKEGLDRVAQLLGLTALLARKPSQLSGGQQQRVAMARAIIAEAPLCLMDEPMSNLDAQLRNEMRLEIHALQKKLGITMLYVTHDQVEAMSMADQIVLLNAGHVEQIDGPSVMYAKPQTRFAAEFIGTPPMSVFAPTATVRDMLRADFPKNVVDREDLLLGLRPEEVRFSDVGAPSKILQTEYLGADIIFHCEIGEHRILVRKQRGDQSQVGDIKHLSWNKENVHFFSSKTGQSID